MYRDTEIKDIVFAPQLLSDFISNNDSFIPFKATKIELLETRHLMWLYNCNLAPANDNKIYTLFGISINHYYAYLKKTDQYCLYLFLNIDQPDQLEEFIGKLGMPWNVAAEDYAKRDFDMLLWEKDGLEISLKRIFDGQKELIITNLPLADLVNNSPW